MSEAKPWEDVAESETTKRIKEGTRRLKMSPPKMGSPKPPKTPRISALEEPFKKAQDFEKRNKKLAKGLKPLSDKFSGTP